MDGFRYEPGSCCQSADGTDIDQRDRRRPYVVHAEGIEFSRGSPLHILGWLYEYRTEQCDASRGNSKSRYRKLADEVRVFPVTASVGWAGLRLRLRLPECPGIDWLRRRGTIAGCSVWTTQSDRDVEQRYAWPERCEYCGH